MKKITLLLPVMLFFGLVAAQRQPQNLTKPYQEPTGKAVVTTTCIFDIQTFSGYGREKFANNFKKQEVFSGIKGRFRLKKLEEFFIFGSIFYNRQKGVDYTPLGAPTTWNYGTIKTEGGIGFNADIPFRGEKFGVIVELESDLTQLLYQKYPIPTFFPSIYFRKNHWRVFTGNKLDIRRDGFLQPIIGFELTFEK